MNLTKDVRENKQDKTKSEERLQISAEIGKVPDNKMSFGRQTHNPS